MSTDTERSPALVAVLSILGILAIAIVGGMLLFQKQEVPGGGLDIGTALSSRETDTTGDEFDPISWARDGAAYPPLENPEEADDDFTAVYTGEGSLPESAGDENTTGDTPTEPTVTKQPASVNTTPTETIAAPEPKYREVRENAYWVQAGSWKNASSADRVREELSDAGFPANVIAQQIDGATWYRVRVGAFDNESEAENYAKQIRSGTSFENSFVVQAPVTRKVPVDG